MVFINENSKYKILNLVLFILVSLGSAFAYSKLKQACVDVECLYEVKFALYQPLYFGGRVLAVILAILIFVPPRMFIKWLVFLAVPMILITHLLVINVSVYSSGILSMSRAQVAQFGMLALGLLSALFVVGQLMYDRRKKKLSA